eukprot:2417010-Pyramimonas_sp.AAC.1
MKARPPARPSEPSGRTWKCAASVLVLPPALSGPRAQWMPITTHSIVMQEMICVGRQVEYSAGCGRRALGRGC